MPETRHYKQDLFEMVSVMNAITSERNLDRLLKLIVTSAVDITRSDAASLYLLEGNMLEFVVTTNKTLEKRMGIRKFEESFKPFHIPITTDSISGYVAATGENLNIKDVYKLEGLPYSFNKSFDEKNDYRAKSMLTIPLINRQGEIIGVLQLMNKLNEQKKVTYYREYDIEIACSLGSQAAISIDNVRLNERLKESYYESILRLSTANEFRDNETGDHVKRVSYYCEAIARAMKEPPEYITNIKYASPLHDIGKIGIPDNILKKPGKLTDEEFKIMQEHTTIGDQILGHPDNEIIALAKEVTLSHHEKWDGSGYPQHLKGLNIPLSGRILAVADVFDALSNPRIYKPAYSLEKTYSILKEGRGTHFDPDILDAFFSIQETVEGIYNIYKDPAPRE